MGVGLCGEFAAEITAGCDHWMRAGTASCSCPGCGIECRGHFVGCAEVWARGPQPERPVRVRMTPTPTPAPTRDKAPPGKPAPDPESGAAKPRGQTGFPGVGDRRSNERASRLRADFEAMQGVLECSVEKITAELDARAEEIDERAADHLRALEQARASLPEELRRSIAEDLPRMVTEAVSASLDTQPAETAGLETLVVEAVGRALADRQEGQPGLEQLVADAVLRSVQARQGEQPGVEGLVADAVGRALDAREEERHDVERLVAEAVGQVLDARLAEHPALKQAGAPRLLTEHDAIVEARHRSLDKRIDGLTRRTQEIDDRLTTRLRTVDDDRAVLPELVRRQDQLARSLAAAVTVDRHDHLAEWVHEAVPTLVAETVQAAMGVHSSALAEAQERADRTRSETEARAGAILASSERTLETLFRRDEEISEVATAHRRALEDERAALAALIEGGRDHLAHSLLDLVPPIVDDAVRAAMARYTTERRPGAREIETRVQADSDVARDALQRSFEKMSEALARREQAMEERADARLKALDIEKAGLAELRTRVAGALTEALPAMVDDAVRSGVALHRAEIDAARQETERIRARTEASTAELREAVAEMRATLARRDTEQQSAANERALEGLRSAMGIPAARPNGHSNPPPAATPPAPTPPAPTPPARTPPARTPSTPPPEHGFDPTNGGRVAFGRSVVPREQRVERRMLRIDDSDGGPWRPLERRQAALSDLLDGPGANDA